MSDLEKQAEQIIGDNTEIQRLASLSPVEYDRIREEKAKELKIRVSTLDREVEQYREPVSDGEGDQVVEELEPWPEKVDGSELAGQFAKTLADYVTLPAGACTAITLFCLGTYSMEARRLWPKLLITSPEKRCGKSTLLEVVEGLSFRALLTSSITASSLFRCVEAWEPTLLIDEADTFAKDNDELNGIINCGHTKRTATVIRSEKIGDTFEPRKFSVWCPQIIAGIKAQRDTLHDRSVIVEMRRKMPGESVQKIPADLYERLQPLRRKALRWSLDNIEAVRACNPDVPNMGNDRAQDNWWPLFGLADTIGGTWPERVRKAYAALTPEEGDESVGPMLLQDIRHVFDDLGVEVLYNEELVGELIEMEERPWPEWKHGKPMTKASLARLLRPFKVKSQLIRIGQTVKRGFRREDFTEAWARYLVPSQDTPAQSVTTLQPSDGAGFSDFQNVTEDDGVTLENPEKPHNGAACNTVTLSEGPLEDNDYRRARDGE